MPITDILCAMEDLLLDCTNTKSLNIRPYHDDGLTVDHWRTGSVEIDSGSIVSTEIDQFQASLTHVQHSVELRICKVTSGTHSATRNALLELCDTVKAVLTTPNGTLGVHSVLRNSTRFPSLRVGPVDRGSESNLSKRVAQLSFSCIELQDAQSRT